MQSLEATFQEGECEYKKARVCCKCAPCHADAAGPAPGPVPDGPFDLLGALGELGEAGPAAGPLHPLVLEQLARRQRLNTLVLNLYAGGMGYSFACRIVSRTDGSVTQEEDTASITEMLRKTYEQSDLLNYINDEEIPPHLSDILARRYSYLFYSGCIICEVREYTKSHKSYQSHHVLLKPTQKSLMADTNCMLSDRLELTLSDRDTIESQLLLATEPSLCLDPDMSLETRTSEIHNTSRAWSTKPFKRVAQKCSYLVANRRAKLQKLTRVPGVSLHDFTNMIKSRTEDDPIAKAMRRTHRGVPKPAPVASAVKVPAVIGAPPDGIFIRKFKAYQRPAETNDDFLPQLIEEYVFETDMPPRDNGDPRVYHIKLSIFQRPVDCEYLGELYLDRDHKQGEQNGVSCRFSLGSRANAHRYIHQFKEIFTESGRKPVRVQHVINPDLKDRVKQVASANQNINMAIEHLNQLAQKQANCVGQPNGVVVANSGSIVPPILQGTIVNNNQKLTQEMGIKAIANELMSYEQQFQPAKQQHKYVGESSTDMAIKNLLKAPSPISTDGADLALSATHQRILSRKMSLGGARVLQPVAGNSRIALAEPRVPQGQTQTIALSGGAYVNYTSPKQQIVNQRIINNSSEPKSLQALLVGTAAADRPDIIGPNTNSSLLLEKLPGTTQNYTKSGTPNSQQFVVQSPKGNAIVSSALQNVGTNSVQGLNFVQVTGFNPPISLPLSSNVHGHPASLLVSVPVTNNSTSVSSSDGTTLDSVEGQTVVLTNAGASNFVHLVSSKNSAQQQGRTVGGNASQTMSIAPGSHQFQIYSQLQRSGRQQLAGGQAQLTGLTRTLPPGAPITFKVTNPGQLSDLQYNFDN